MGSVDPFRVVIVGGGIAGLTAAIALRAPNRHITVLEQSSLNKEIGALISLQPNASKIVERTWELTPELEASRGMVDEGFRIYSIDGEMVNSIPLLTKTEFDAHRLMFHRQDLHDSFKQAAVSPTRSGPPVNIRVAARVADCDPHAGTVKLDSGEIIKADLIVGADGIHSRLRRHIAPDVSPMPTGLSAYRLLIPTAVLEEREKEFCSKINPRSPYTSMIVAHNCRLIMGPGRGGEVYGIVALVPDEKMNEDPNEKQSWVDEGDLNKMMEAFSGFPKWVTNIFRHSDDLGLWQLRDIDPLPTWNRDRLILIGDAAHAMLPTQGQGASQAIEDAEALGAFFEGVHDPPSPEHISATLQKIVDCRSPRASLIQAYSRQSARPGTVEGQKTVTMNPGEFMAFNCMYEGAKKWAEDHAGGAL